MIPKPKRNTVNVVLDVMDEGPRPMKNMKVTEKNRNCVDQFWDAHQAEYEARGKQSRDAVERVNQHNLTYPRLGDELNRRQSFSKVKTNPQRSDGSKRSYDAACAACTKQRRLSQLQKINIKPKCKQRKIKNKTRPRDIKSRVGKNRYRTTKRNKCRLPNTISVNKVTKCHCCYVSVKHKRVGNDTSTNLGPKNSKQPFNILNERKSSNSKINNVQPKDRISCSSKERNVQSKERMISSSNENVQPKERMNFSEPEILLSNERMNDLKNAEEGSGKSSIKTLKNPDTSVASMSSYNSYASLDHEPMVNMEL